MAGQKFAFAPVARLTELQATATLDRIEADLTLGAADATMIGELANSRPPTSSRASCRASHARALAATGRRSKALAVYQRTRESTWDRLGVDPSQQLGQAYLAILRQEVPQAATPQADTPAASSRPQPGQSREASGPRPATVGGANEASSAGTTTW